MVKCLFSIQILFIYYFSKILPRGVAARALPLIHNLAFPFKTKMLVQLDGGMVHILTMLNDVAHFTVIKREVAHYDKKVGHPGHIVYSSIQ